MMPTDEELMLDFQRGARESFDELFARYRQRVYGFFRRRACDAGRAEDLAQETFLAVLRGSERYEPRATFRSYLFGIAFRQLFSERRRGKQAQLAEPHRSDTAHEPLIMPADPTDSFWVRRAVEQLDSDHREVLLLREFEQLSYAEIAELLRIPVNTVRTRLFRARMELKSLLLPGISGTSEAKESSA